MKRTAWALIAANAVAVTAFVLHLRGQGVAPARYGWDLEILRAGGKLLLEHRAIYDLDQQMRVHLAAGHGELARFPFAYPPLLAIEIAPLAAVSNLAALAFVAVAGACLLGWVAKKTTGSPWAALAVTASFPGLAVFFAGQLAWFALGIFAATTMLLKRERPLAAGAVASLLAYKPTLLVMVPAAFVMLPSRARALAGLAAGLAVELLVSFAIAPGAVRAYPGAAAAFSRYVQANPSLFDSVTWRTSLGAAGPLAIGACAIAAAAWMWRSRADVEMVMATCVLATLVCAWHCLPYDYALVALPFFWLGGRLEKRELAGAAALLAVVSWSVIALPNRWLALALYPPVLLVFSAWLVSRAGAPERERGTPR